MNAARLPTAAVLAAFGALLLGSCAPDRSWRRVDLWADPPTVEGVVGETALKVTSRRGEHERGHERVARHPPLVRGLQQHSGTVWIKRLSIGRESFFEFLSIPVEGEPCGCSHRVSARSSSRPLTVLAEIPAHQPTRFGPQPEQVRLAPFRDEEVELILEISPADGTASVIWGNPAVNTRLPMEGGLRPGSDSPKKLNVLLIGVDTLRARALGAWGRDPSLTPALDQLAAESDVWINAYSTFNATNPSFTSIFTGLYGKDHGIYTQSEILPPESRTLAEVFQDAGYATFGVFSVRHFGRSGVDQGLDRAIKARQGAFSGRLAVDEAMNWLDGIGTRPFFAFVHLWDPHSPHTPPEPYDLGLRHSRAYGLGPVDEWIPFREVGPREHVTARAGGGHVDLYDGEVAYTDRQVDRLIGYVEARGLLDTTLVAFVADHGENLGEHELLFRHSGLYETTTHVPLMVRWPGTAPSGRVFEGLAQTLDLFPTLLEAAGLEAPAHSGISLAELADREPAGRRVVFSEHANRFGEAVVTRRFRYSVLRGGPNVDGEVRQLYQHEADPGEESNLVEREPELAQRLAEVLAKWVAERGTLNRATPAENLDPETIQQLESLGYLTR